MKQSAAKTLGVAALGAAFAAAGTGAAHAAPAVVPDTGSVVNTAEMVTSALPAEDVSKSLPAGDKERAVEGPYVLTPVTGPTLAGWALAQGLTSPASLLLGGMPVQAVPVQAVPVGSL
ncbi:ATP-binding protein [Streptomyces blattellae]|uniref:ATP-binding protein n=1 Tax=Streptomyces blattellae TaxID=2569855 RepID=UPI0012B9EBE3|nr:ATP-binding protein [Streptomyces blattellae]